MKKLKISDLIKLINEKKVYYVAWGEHVEFFYNDNTFITLCTRKYFNTLFN